MAAARRTWDHQRLLQSAPSRQLVPLDLVEGSTDGRQAVRHGTVEEADGPDVAFEPRGRLIPEGGLVPFRGLDHALDETAASDHLRPEVPGPRGPQDALDAPSLGQLSHQLEERLGLRGARVDGRERQPNG